MLATKKTGQGDGGDDADASEADLSRCGHWLCLRVVFKGQPRYITGITLAAGQAAGTRAGRPSAGGSGFEARDDLLARARQQVAAGLVAEDARQLQRADQRRGDTIGLRLISARRQGRANEVHKES